MTAPQWIPPEDVPDQLGDLSWRLVDGPDVLSVLPELACLEGLEPAVNARARYPNVSLTLRFGIW